MAHGGPHGSGPSFIAAEIPRLFESSSDRNCIWLFAGDIRESAEVCSLRGCDFHLAKIVTAITGLIHRWELRSSAACSSSEAQSRGSPRDLIRSKYGETNVLSFNNVKGIRPGRNFRVLLKVDKISPGCLGRLVYSSRLILGGPLEAFQSLSHAVCANITVIE